MRKLHHLTFGLLCLLFALVSTQKRAFANVHPLINVNSSEDVTSNPKYLPQSIRKIVIDAGHGGRDNGCSVDHIREKKVNLAVALKLGSLLSKNYPNLQIIYTRTTDTFVSLDRRIEVANGSNADLFISIHCNYVKETEVSGSETYILGNSSHNSTHHDHDHHHTSGAIGSSLDLKINNHTYAKSIDIAHAIEQSFASLEGFKSRGVKKAAFTVLKETTMPSVLVEMGFLSNNFDQLILTSNDGQNVMAQSMFNACLDFFETLRQRESISHKPEVVKYHDIIAADTFIEAKMKPQESYRVQFAEFAHYPLIDSTDKWKNLGLIEVKQVDQRFLFLTKPYKELSEALSHKTILENKGFKGAFVIVDSEE